MLWLVPILIPKGFNKLVLSLSISRYACLSSSYILLFYFTTFDSLILGATSNLISLSRSRTLHFARRALLICPRTNSISFLCFEESTPFDLRLPVRFPSRFANSTCRHHTWLELKRLSVLAGASGWRGPGARSIASRHALAEIYFLSSVFERQPYFIHRLLLEMDHWVMKTSSKEGLYWSAQ